MTSIFILNVILKKSGHSIKVPTIHPNFYKKKFPTFATASFKKISFLHQMLFYMLLLFILKLLALSDRYKDYWENRCLFVFLTFLFIVGCVILLLFFRTVSHFLLQKANLQSDEWHVDETYIKVKGQKHSLWILLDSETRVVIAFCLSSVRDSNTALTLFENHVILQMLLLWQSLQTVWMLIICLFCLLIPNRNIIGIHHLLMIAVIMY